MGCKIIKFISDNVRAINNSHTHVKIFDYLENKVDFNGVLFLK